MSWHHRRKLALLQRNVVAKIGEHFEDEADFCGWFAALQLGEKANADSVK